MVLFYVLPISAVVHKPVDSEAWPASLSVEDQDVQIADFYRNRVIERRFSLHTYMHLHNLSCYLYKLSAERSC